MSLIDDIKDRLHIDDIVAETVRLTKAGKNMRGLCPFHTEDTASFFVFPDSQRFKCFGCGAGGDVLDFVMEVEGWDLSTAIREMARKAGIEMLPLSVDQKRAIDRQRENEQVFAAAAEFFHARLGLARGEQAESGSPGLTYARQRGFEDTTLREGGVGYFGKDWGDLRTALAKANIDLECPPAVALIGYRGDVRAWAETWDVELAPRWIEEQKIPAMPPDMLIYPHVLKGRVTYLSGRHLSPTGPKSWNPPSSLVGPRQPYFNALWNQRKPGEGNEDTFPFSAVVEGQACALSLHQWGVPGAALAGCDLGERIDADHVMMQQIKRQLAITNGQLVMGLDNDTAGEEATPKLAQSLMTGLELKATSFRRALWPAGDVNAWLQEGANREDAQALLACAPSWIEVLLEAATPAEDEEEPDEQAVRTLFAALAGLDVYDVARMRERVSKALKIKRSTFDGLLKAARQEAGLADDGKPRYVTTGGRLCHRFYDSHGNEVYNPLSNFTAQIAAEIVEDDGDTQERVFRIHGKLADGTFLPPVDVNATEFSSMGWVLALWGARAVVEAGGSTRDHLRAAIQATSRDVESRFVYAHLGWRSINQEQVYLSGSGAVGRDGVEVRLPPDLMRYRLPQQPENVDEALRKSFQFLEVGDYAVTVPLLAAMFLSPLSTIIPPSFTLWVYGTTGSLKSTITALAFCHYGKFSYNTPPASWTGTANALERKTFLVKDAPLWIDDYTTQSTFSGMNELKAKVDRLLRDWGNRSGRSRMQANMKLRQTFAPQGLIISTAEQLPPGQSIQARLFQVEVHPDMVTRGADSPLTLAQTEHAQCYAHSMAGYVLWLAEQYDTLKQDLPERLLDYTEAARARGAHLRMPNNVATLFLGWEMFLNYAQHVGALEVDYDDLRELGWSVLVALGDAQQVTAQEEKPVDMYISALSELIAQGSVYLRHREYPEIEEKTLPTGQHKAVGAEFLGWHDDQYLYLIPGVTFKTINLFYRGRGVVFPDTERGVKVKMKEEGLLFPTERSQKTFLYQMPLDGRPWVLRIANILSNDKDPLPENV
jgi:DNA primase